MQQLVNYNGQLINLNGGVLANKFPIRDGLMLYVDSRIDASYPRTGTTVNDLSVSALSGTLYNGVDHTPNKYFSLDGTNDYIEIPLSGDATKTYTVNLMTKVTGGRSTDANQIYNRTTFFSLSNSAISDSRGYRTFAFQSWNFQDEQILYFRGNGSSYYTGTFTLQSTVGGLGDFHLYSIVYSPDTTKVYVNGVLTRDIAHTIGNNGFHKLWIGTRYATQFFVDQPMSEDFGFLQMYERELSQSEIQSIYSNVKQDYEKIIEDGLVLNLDADNHSSYIGYGTPWYDVSPSGNDATLVNGPTYQSEPAAIVFDGVNDYATVYDDSDVFEDNDSFTATVWFSYDYSAFDSPNNNGGVMGSQRYFTEPGDPGGWGIHYNYVGGSARIFLMLTDASGASGPVSYQQLALINTFEFEKVDCYTFSYDSSTGTVKGYKNGSLESSSVNLNYAWTPNKAGRLTQIGRATQGGWSWYEPVTVAEVQVYKRVLTDDEIAYNFEARRGRYGI